MRPLLWIVCVAFIATAHAQSRSYNAGEPAPNETRAMSAMRAAATGAWINGDWGLKIILSTGKAPNKTSAPLDIIGGWTPTDGRWQRVHLPSGQQWLIKGRSVTTIWSLGAGKIKPLTPEERLAPIIDRIPLNWELYTMSFLSWPGRSYLGVERVRGRWADKVELTDISEQYSRAIVWVDVEFGAPLEAQLYNNEGKLSKTLRAVSMQKVDKDWILRRWEVLDAISHAKVTLDVVAVALGGQWPAALYNETALITDWPTIAPEYWKPLE